MDIWSLLMCGYMPPDVAWAVKAMDWASEPMFYKFAWVVVAIWKLVGVRGFEPPTPSSRRKCATRLRYTPKS